MNQLILIKKNVEIPDNWTVIEDCPPGAYIAGSFALYLSTYMHPHKPGDVDYFFTDQDSLDKCINLLGIAEESEWTYRQDKIHVIKKVFKSPFDILDSFDIDPCRILYDPITKELWAHEKAIKSYNTGLCTFELSKTSSERYIPRFMKYIHRGFEIDLPYISEIPLKSKRQVAEILGTSVFHLNNHGQFLNRIFVSIADSLIFKYIFRHSRLVLGSESFTASYFRDYNFLDKISKKIPENKNKKEDYLTFYKTSLFYDEDKDVTK